MKYNGFYYWMFAPAMKEVLKEHLGADEAKVLMKRSKPVYRRIVAAAPELGDDNPMAYNELFALAFISPYIASGKTFAPELVREMMERGLYRVKWYFSLTDVNSEKGKAANKKNIMKYFRWYTPQKEKQYPDSFKVDFVGQPYEGACYYRITRCPICSYMETLGCRDLMPMLCELDEVMISMQHGVLHRQHTIADGSPYCDYWITGDHENVRP